MKDIMVELAELKKENERLTEIVKGMSEWLEIETNHAWLMETISEDKQNVINKLREILYNRFGIRNDDLPTLLDELKGHQTERELHETQAEIEAARTILVGALDKQPNQDTPYWSSLTLKELADKAAEEIHSLIIDYDELSLMCESCPRVEKARREKEKVMEILDNIPIKDGYIAKIAKHLWVK
jgi:hypothetical protein